MVVLLNIFRKFKIRVISSRYNKRIMTHPLTLSRRRFLTYRNQSIELTRLINTVVLNSAASALSKKKNTERRRNNDTAYDLAI